MAAHSTPAIEIFARSSGLRVPVLTVIQRFRGEYNYKLILWNRGAVNRSRLHHCLRRGNAKSARVPGACHVFAMQIRAPERAEPFLS